MSEREIVWVAGQRRSRWLELADVIAALKFHYKRMLFGAATA